MTFVAWRYRAIAWTNVDWPAKVFWGIHLNAILPEVFSKLIRNMYSEITLKNYCHIVQGPTGKQIMISMMTW